ncbi:TIM-barrel domain-containing protein [Flavitalea sp.]|nr:TIM-barrel domain-containing protein [Flavitalea sp.]
MKKRSSLFLLPLFLVFAWLPLSAAGQQNVVTNTEDGIVVHMKNPGENKTRIVKLQVISDKIIHVTASAVDSFVSVPSLMTVLPGKPAIKWTIKESSESVTLTTPALNTTVQLENGEVSFTGKEGRLLLKEKNDGRLFKPWVLEGGTTYQLQQRFESPEDEGLYGLGQHQSGVMNYKNRQVDLTQNNTEVAIPFLLSSKNYGLLWDNYSITKVGDSREYKQLNSLKLFSLKDEQGWLTATYSNKNDRSQVFIERPESFINYEFIPLLKQLPAGLDLGKTIVTWQGSIVSGINGLHYLNIKYAGYTKVWIDGKLLMDRWRQSWNPGTVELPVQMEAGRKHAIKIEWDGDGGESYIAVKWLGPLNAEQKKEYAFKSESGSQVNYYFIHGENADEVIAGYRRLTGEAPIMPKWAMGFWQSRERYKTQQELVDVVAEFRKRKIPLDNIVLDWSYWEEDKWGSQDFDVKRFPDAAGMIKTLHEKYNTQFMISVWPKFYEGIDSYKTFDSNGWLFKRNIANRQRDWIAKGYVSTFYDAFNPDARKAFWSLVNNKLYTKGVDAWWMDATEPDIYSNSSVEDRKLLMTPTAIGSSTTYFNAFPLQNARGIYEGQRAANPDKRVFILTRSAYAGMQRYAAATWSGDIASRWHDFKDQIPAGLNFSMSGLPYWTMDIGGFAVERRNENAKGEELEEWREMNARWFQYGAFCPIFRSHGQFPFREIFNIAPEEHPAYKTMLYYNKLRYRLMPYIYTLAGRAYHEQYTIMRGLIMDFGSDANVQNITDQYMFGDAFLVNPVTDYKATTRKIYLPAGTGWFNFYDGTYLEGGAAIEATAPLEQMPLYVKAGSIVPVGPELQYTAEKPADLITLFIYGGKDARYNLYEDENTNYNYELGKFSVIPISYSDANGTVTIDGRKGSFTGMLKNRTFNIVLVAKNKPVAFNPDLKTPLSIKYSGSKVIIHVKK